MPLQRIRLELARDRDFPQGSSERGYELVAPLTEDSHLDAETWRRERKRCLVRRFWPGEADEVGHLRHYPGGAWGFHYDIEGDADHDEPGYKLDRHLFRVGEYVSVKEQDGSLLTFKVVRVQRLA